MESTLFGTNSLYLKMGIVSIPDVVEWYNWKISTLGDNEVSDNFSVIHWYNVIHMPQALIMQQINGMDKGLSLKMLLV